MKKIELEIPEGKEVKWVNNVLTLVDKPVSIMDRVWTFEDACYILGEEHPFVKAYNEVHNRVETIGVDFHAYLKLRIISATLNEGWEPQFTEDECRYCPKFFLYTRKEIDEMDEERKNRVWCQPYHYVSTCGGVAYDGVACASIGSRLAFKSSELAEYAGKQFIQIWCDFLLG